VCRRPDSGGVEGEVIPLLANHFSVDFDFSKRIFHYDVELSPLPSKEVARMIKKKLVDQHSSMLSGAHPAYDGRRAIYSPIEFQQDKLELYISLPLSSSDSPAVFPCQEKDKIFKLRIKLVSKLDGEALRRYLLGEEDEDGDSVPFPQEYIHALDVVLRERSREKLIESGQSFYSSSMEGGEGIGGGAVALRGFFQSLRPTSQGLSLNVDFSMTAFYESIGVLLYLQKRFDFMIDLSQERCSGRSMTSEEREEVDKALHNMRVFVLHRQTVQRYLVHGLTKESAGDLWFSDRDGKRWNLVEYFEERYGYGVVHVNLPCLQISRRKPCFVPMELCVVCEGQKFIGKLTEEQTAKMLKISCQRPHERKKIINGVMETHLVSDGDQVKEFELGVAREMTEVKGRILKPPPPAAKLGHNAAVVGGLRIERWGVISFGGSPEERSRIPNFITHLSKRCQQSGIFLNKNVDPLFEPMHVLGSPGLLETKLCKIRNKASDDLQLLICVMERKHKGYADLKCIAETRIGVVTQCCLYSNLGNKMSSQFLANMALKISAKLGGSTASRHGYLHCEIPRLFRREKPVIFMGADVTHPHPLDDCSPSVAAVVGTVNWPAANRYVSKMRSQKHREEIIQELSSMVAEILQDFYEELSHLPSRIVFFRDGVSETQFRTVLERELRSIRRGCRSRFPGYDPPITFMVVQKRHHTRLFPRESDQNVPPGTVVDSVITHPREFDFYLCSHLGVKGTSRPIHYHVLWDENGFTSDEIQKLVYNLCYTFVRCTVPVSLVPPAYYAHLAAYRGRLYLHRSAASSGISRASPPETVPLPRISDNIRKLMFYC
ncbi:hypothetical protein M569_07337, partial [Genlisea aurea]